MQLFCRINLILSTYTALMNCFSVINKNNLKKFALLGTVLVLVFGTLSHFVYEWSGENRFAAAFFPVNESTWEHMKLLFFPMLAFVLSFAPSLKQKYPNILPASFCGILSGTFLIPVLFYTYSGILGFTLTPADIAIFFVSVIAAFAVTYKLAGSRARIPQSLTVLLSGSILAVFLLFVLFSFYPPDLGIFKDPS